MATQTEENETTSTTSSCRCTLTTFTCLDCFRKQAHTYLAENDGDHGPFYNSWVGKYTQICRDGGYCAPASLAAVASDVIGDKSSRILDAASGTGMVGEELKGRGFTYIDALDPSQVSLDKSKEHQSYTDYICDTLDEHQTKIPDDCYEAVLICGSFGEQGHVSDVCFPELIRITKPGGLIMFTVSVLALPQWEDKLEAAIQAIVQKGLWEVVEYRWVPYIVNEVANEKSKVPILRVLKSK